MPDRLSTPLLAAVPAILFSGLVGAEEVHTFEVELTLAEKPAAQDAVKAVDAVPAMLVLHRDGVEPEEIPVTVPGPVSLQVPRAASRVRLTLEARGLWAAEQLLLPKERSGSLEIPVHPASQLLAKIRVPRGETLPRTVSLRLDRPEGEPERRGIPDQVVLTCPVEETGALACKIPPGAFDVRLAGRGFIPRYFWRWRAPPREVVDLGSLLLRPGASVAGWIDRESLAAEGPPCHVRLENLAVKEAPGNPKGLHGRSHRAAVGGGGFFQLSGIPPGRYVLTAEREGLARSPALEINVLDGRESSLLEPLVLEPLARLKLHVDPHLDTYWRPWNTSLTHEVGGAAVEGSGPMPEDGSLFFEQVPAGRYALRITNHRGDRWHRRELEILPEDAEITVELAMIRIEGTLSVGPEPLEAHLWLGTRQGPLRVHRYAGEDGTFSGYLPRTGTWDVEIQLPGKERQTLPAPPIEVEPDEEGVARVDIRLPGTSLEGVVVDSHGEPIPGALVTVRRAETGHRTAEQRTDEQGGFLFRGLPEGPASVYGRHAGATSERQTVDLLDAVRGPALRLVLDEGYRITGQVVSAAGPVPRARVIVLPNWIEGTYRNTGDVSHFTGPSGELEAWVPSNTLDLHVTVLAPGFSARVLRLPVTEEPLVLDVDQHGGTLRLREPANASALHRGGAASSVVVLRAFWARPDARREERETGILTLLDMEPGEYALCPASRPASQLQNCSRGFLPAGGELELTMPAAASTPASR